MKLREREESIETESPEQQRRVRERTEHLLYAGVGINVLVAILLILFFMKGITTRLAVLVDNTRRLAAGRPLNPVLTGSDEIAGLDRTFHEMATALDEYSKMRQAFVAMISHELRTPLTGVQGFLTLVARGMLPPDKLSAKAAAAENSVARLISLINELLDLEKLESGTISLNLAPVEVARILEHSDEAVATLAEKKDIYIDLPSSEATLVADADRLIQVLVNLLSNAIKFSPEGGGIRVSVEVEPDYIEFRVKDRGRGIPAKFRELVFERFQQVETADSTKGRGTGLGLPICKAIVEQHGGKIGVESEEGKGSEFWFQIPTNLQARSG